MESKHPLGDVGKFGENITVCSANRLGIKRKSRFVIVLSLDVVAANANDHLELKLIMGITTTSQILRPMLELNDCHLRHHICHRLTMLTLSIG